MRATPSSRAVSPPALNGQDTTGCLALAARVAAWSVATDGDWEGLPAPTGLALDEAPPGTVTQ
ncbi:MULTISPECIES: hypothetical protein [Streptomyces]|uniref:hypothetical protein n=1 Tax=Streptomyces TaxID=1883 RepID=UPI00198439FB|nr:MULTISPECIES: hypothetical protein [Streptomyces]GGS12798.1 hypothetical protein GCM10010236_79090 [Streptomyces eurythermus]